MDLKTLRTGKTGIDFTQAAIAGGLYGLLVGDALGVPYEFYEAKELPVYEKIEMTPPARFQKTYPRIATGTWSDDGAQALCLMDSLLKHGKESYLMWGFRQPMRLTHIKEGFPRQTAD